MAVSRSIARMRRFDTTAEASGVVLEENEFGWDIQAKVLKLGDGATAWAGLVTLVDIA